MKNIQMYNGKKVFVLGLAKSGYHAALLLKKLSAEVTVSYQNSVSDNIAAQTLQAAGITVTNSPQTSKQLTGCFDLMVKNPGIAYDVPLVQAALSKHLPIITEVELASEINEGELVAVTGSNGKTTTTTMITKILNKERYHGRSVYAGNIGVSASEVAQEMTSVDTLVLEVSSFMLLGISTFHPHIAVLTNIFSNHLNYHKTHENYVNAKMQITTNQTSDDYFIVNFDSPELRTLARHSRAKVIPFSRKAVITDGAYERNNKLYFRDEFVIDTSELRIMGSHNIENVLAAIAVAKISGRSTNAIKSVLKTFSGVRHRTQYILTASGRKYYNDSKATDVEATEMALSGFKEPIVLLAGGLDRGYNFDKLIPYFKVHVKSVVLFGETQQLLAKAAKEAGITTIKYSENVESAVPIAYELSSPGDVILLSPANASWDQYPNFEVRGDRFIRAVETLTGQKEEKQ